MTLDIKGGGVAEVKGLTVMNLGDTCHSVDKQKLQHFLDVQQDGYHQ